MFKKDNDQILGMARGLNFWGKKLDTKRRDVAGKIADAFTNGQQVAELIAFLDANKPAKAEKIHVAIGPVEPEFTCTRHHYDNATRLEGDRPVIVYAVQNNASICGPVMQTIRRVADELDAEIIPCRIGYIVDKDRDSLDHVPADTLRDPFWIGDHLVLAGDVIPTAKKPINHAKLASNGRPLTILPHTRQQAESLPRAKGSPESWAITTGSATLPRYRQGRAGSEAHADHCLGFSIIEPDGSFKQIQLNEDGIGYHAGIRFSPDGITDQTGGMLVLGDVHAEKMDHDFLSKTTALIETIKPDHIVIHDLFDMTSRNHHNRQSGLFIASQGDRTVADDLQDAIDVLDEIQGANPDAVIHIVNSNHDRALDTWLDDPSVDPRKDAANLPLWCDLQKLRYQIALAGGALPVTLESAITILMDEVEGVTYGDNVRFFGEDQSLLINGVEYGQHGDSAITILMDEVEGVTYGDNVRFLGEDQSLLINGVEYGQHGDRGINGARGGYTAFEKLGSCYVIGHSHSGYKNGRRVAVAGVTGSLDMGYNKGASSWSHSHVFIGADGIPQIIMGIK